MTDEKKLTDEQVKDVNGGTWDWRLRRVQREGNISNPDKIYGDGAIIGAGTDNTIVQHYE